MAELDLGFIKIPSELTAIEKQPDSDGSYSFPCDGKKYTLLKDREVTPTFTLSVLFENASGNTTKGTYNISSSKFFADGVISCNFQFASVRTRVDINEDGTPATTTTIVFTFVVNGVEKTFTYGTGLGSAYVLMSGSETLTVKNITKAVMGEASVTSAILANTAEYAETANTATTAETAETANTAETATSVDLKYTHNTGHLPIDGQGLFQIVVNAKINNATKMIPFTVFIPNHWDGSTLGSNVIAVHNDSQWCRAFIVLENYDIAYMRYYVEISELSTKVEVGDNLEIVSISRILLNS